MLLNLLDLPAWYYLGLCTLFGVLLLTGAVQGKSRPVQSIARGLLVSYGTFLIFFGGGELYFRYVYADSGWAFTLAHKNWEERYWQRNSRGFRDQEWSEEDLTNKKTIAILGDSFASGWGVNDPQDRFPDVLAVHLGDEYAVVNLAIPGMSTPQQLELLQENPPQKPDVVLLQYFLNDIELASASIGRLWVDDWVTPPPENSIAMHSYLLNHIYWIVYPLTHSVNATFEGSYWQWQYGTYDTFAIWEIHEAQLHELIDYVEQLEAELYVVIFPNMEDPVGSVPYVDRVKFVFEERGYGEHVMPLYDEVAGWNDPQPITASPRDAHPSAAFHRFVGDQIYQRWFAGE